jgi:hypothetical protein
MTTDLEEQLRAGMRQEVAGITPSGDVLGAATRRYRRRAAAVRLGYAMGVAGLAGAVAVALTGGVGAPGQPDTGGPSAAQPLPASRKLANAAAASDNISYRVRLTISATAATDGAPSGGGVSEQYEGAFDPRTATGYTRTTTEAGVITELLIDGTRYIGTEPLPHGRSPAGTHETYGRYGQYQGKYDRLSFGLSAHPVLGATTADPPTLLKALQQVNATTSENPDGTLHFQYRQESTDGVTVTSGDVTLDADGRIAKVTLTGSWQSTVKGRLDTGDYTMSLELSDYGTVVTVTRPTEVVPAN